MPRPAPDGTGSLAIPADTEGLPAIVVRGVSKTFRVPQERKHTLKERALHPRSRTRHQVFETLSDITFAVQEGEFFGVAGRNGSGKSTLLKCIAGIYGADGEIWRRGRVSTFIELGVGFNPDLAARDNVVLNGIMLGLSPREARKRYESVIEFAELKEFEELKLKNYSSGMYVRLAFSVAIQVDADILLIDEVLAVGDAAFQQKCFDVFRDLQDQGKTIVFVTHQMPELQRFCHRAMLLERGHMVHIGDPKEVADRYLELNFGRDPEALGADGARGGDGDARVLDVWVEDEKGERQVAIPQGQRIALRALVHFMVDVEDPQASVQVHNAEHKPVLVAASWRQHDHSGRFRAGEHAKFSFAFDNVLAPGRYSPVVDLAHRGAGLDVIDRYEHGFSFVVTATDAQGGLVDLPTEVTIERVDAGVAAEITA
ncbi:MAG TPA: ABC transporter ATP-binding protein [Solirubrobacteraceae bacterium]|jgi:ABC-type polysaccharide/polyol phosphate transport system ATPase subunit|nr:ABC transporter ATP-binding protein [Solirubrobacteraceae bacterium]